MNERSKYKSKERCLVDCISKNNTCISNLLFGAFSHAMYTLLCISNTIDF